MTQFFGPKALIPLGAHLSLERGVKQPLAKMGAMVVRIPLV